MQAGGNNFITGFAGIKALAFPRSYCGLTLQVSLEFQLVLTPNGQGNKSKPTG